MTSERAPSCTPFIVSSPLWSRAPSRDAQGRPYFDFMMLIPGLKSLDQDGIENITLKLTNCLKAFEHVVVYVDLNTRLNLLWVSIKPVPKVSLHIMQAIQYEIPEARVVAGDFNPPNPKKAASQPLLSRINKSLKKTFFMRHKE